MILIADSGSTKTNWKIIENPNKISSFDTLGLNPIFMNEQEIANETQKINFDKQKVQKIFFYGASCSSESRCDIVKRGLQKTFNNAVIEVNHDMLAAARSLFKNSEGLVGILGTGSNSCLYDGKNIIKQIGGLGFVLGDEGSGADLGKRLIKQYMLNNFDAELKFIFDKEFNLTRDSIINSVYKESNPNKFFAGFAKFISANRNNKLITEIINNSFDEYIKLHFLRYDNYKNYKIKLTGSIAYNFKDEIAEIAKKSNIKISEFVNYPINGLVDYHLLNY